MSTPRDWPAVREWRKGERQRLLAARAALGHEARTAAAASILPFVHEAIRRHGAVRGSLLAFWRVLRCNPFGRPGPDPVPS